MGPSLQTVSDVTPQVVRVTWPQETSTRALKVLCFPPRRPPVPHLPLSRCHSQGKAAAAARGSRVRATSDRACIRACVHTCARAHSPSQTSFFCRKGESRNFQEES